MFATSNQIKFNWSNKVYFLKSFLVSTKTATKHGECGQFERFMKLNLENVHYRHKIISKSFHLTLMEFYGLKTLLLKFMTLVVAVSSAAAIINISPQKGQASLHVWL